MNNDLAKDLAKGMYVTFIMFVLFFFIFLVSRDTLQLFISLCSLLPGLLILIYIKNYDYKYYYLVFATILTLQGLTLGYTYLLKLKTLSLPRMLELVALTLIWIVVIWVIIYFWPWKTIKKET